MNIPTAAVQNFSLFKSQGTLGWGAQRYEVSSEAASTLNDLSRSIDDTVALDNQEGVDRNPQPGELLWEDQDFVRESTVSGDARNGKLVEVAQAKAHDLQSVIFMEASDDRFLSYQAYLDKAGSLTHSWAYVVDRHDPSKTFAESFDAGMKKG